MDFNYSYKMPSVFLGGSAVKNLPANAGDPSSIPGSQRSPGEEMATHSSILAGKSHEQNSLVATVCGITKSWT